VHTEEVNSKVKRERPINYEANNITIIRWTGGRVGDREDQEAVTKREISASAADRTQFLLPSRM
jgi:hypothetical protein